ncbi:hypothetical protein [Novosphingobium sp.]
MRKMMPMHHDPVPATSTTDRAVIEASLARLVGAAIQAAPNKETTA